MALDLTIDLKLLFIVFSFVMKTSFFKAALNNIILRLGQLSMCNVKEATGGGEDFNSTPSWFYAACSYCSRQLFPVFSENFR